MSLGAYLTTKENLELVKTNSWKFGRPKIIDMGMRYYDSHSKEVDQIVHNLRTIGLPSAGTALDDTLRGIVIHYYEKLFSLVKTYEAFWIAKNRIQVGDSLEPFKEAQQTGKAVFIGQSHFGATYFMAAVLMVHGFDVHTVGMFPEPVGSLLAQNSAIMTERYGAGKATLLNLADSSVDVPVEMMKLLFMKKIVSNVYDENNQFCQPVTLLGKQLFGGTGMDLILKRFNDDNVVLVTPFLVRTGNDTFRYEVDRHYFSNGNIIDSFYRSLEQRIQAYPEQWYFIHELHESFEDLREKSPV